MLQRRGFFGDGFLGLPLGSHKQHVLALRGHFAYEARGVLEHFQGFLQVDYVDSVAFAEDVFLHLRIPALGLVPEVNTGFEQFLHRYCGRRLPPNNFRARATARGPKRDLRAGTRHTRCQPRTLTFGELETLARALLAVFLALVASVGRASESPSFFNRDRNSTLNSHKARAIP